jgi:hypothetical protein
MAAYQPGPSQLLTSIIKDTSSSTSSLGDEQFMKNFNYTSSNDFINNTSSQTVTSTTNSNSSMINQNYNNQIQPPPHEIGSGENVSIVNMRDNILDFQNSQMLNNSYSSQNSNFSTCLNNNNNINNNNNNYEINLHQNHYNNNQSFNQDLNNLNDIIFLSPSQPPPYQQHQQHQQHYDPPNNLLSPSSSSRSNMISESNYFDSIMSRLNLNQFNQHIVKHHPRPSAVTSFNARLTNNGGGYAVWNRRQDNLRNLLCNAFDASNSSSVNSNLKDASFSFNQPLLAATSIADMKNFNNNNNNNICSNRQFSSSSTLNSSNNLNGNLNRSNHEHLLLANTSQPHFNNTNNNSYNNNNNLIRQNNSSLSKKNNVKNNAVGHSQILLSSSLPNFTNHKHNSDISANYYNNNLQSDFLTNAIKKAAANTSTTTIVPSQIESGSSSLSNSPQSWINCPKSSLANDFLHDNNKTNSNSASNANNHLIHSSKKNVLLKKNGYSHKLQS